MSDLPSGPAADRVRFREVQPLHRNPVLRIVLVLDAVVMAAVLLPWAVTAPGPDRWIAAGLFAVFGVLVPAGLLVIRLVTVVTDDRLVIRYRPFPGRDVPLASIRAAEALRYDPVRAGGWGWRISPVYHRVFNVRGDRGVHVRYGEGRREQFLVGSERPEELAAALGGGGPPVGAA